MKKFFLLFGSILLTGQIALADDGITFAPPDDSLMPPPPAQTATASPPSDGSCQPLVEQSCLNTFGQGDHWRMPQFLTSCRMMIQKDDAGTAHCLRSVNCLPPEEWAPMYCGIPVSNFGQ